MSNEQMINDILVKNGLNFTIEKIPLMGTYNGNQIISPYFGLLNTQSNEIINTTKAGYTVSQNYDVIDMVLQGMNRFGDKLQVSKAGSINGGRRVFVQLEIEGAAKVGDDTIKQYVTVIDSNDGSTGLSIGIGDVVMHCQNQFFKFYKNGEAKFRHTATITEKIKSIPKLIETALLESIQQVKVYNTFISTPLTEMLAHKMVKEVLGYDRLITSVSEQAKMTKRSIDIMETLYSNIETEKGIVGNNVWALFNGLTRFTTHHQSAPKRENGKIESMLVGSGYQKAITGFDYLYSNS